jgi:hypothetical protein
LVNAKRRLLIRVQLFVAAHLLKTLLVLAAPLAVCAEVRSAVLYQFVPQFFELRTARTLETDNEKQYW